MAFDTDDGWHGQVKRRGPAIVAAHGGRFFWRHAPLTIVASDAQLVQAAAAARAPQAELAAARGPVESDDRDDAPTIFVAALLGLAARGRVRLMPGDAAGWRWDGAGPRPYREQEPAFLAVAGVSLGPERGWLEAELLRRSLMVSTPVEAQLLAARVLAARPVGIDPWAWLRERVSHAGDLGDSAVSLATLADFFRAYRTISWQLLHDLAEAPAMGT
jgi:hypothetical protein